MAEKLLRLVYVAKSTLRFIWSVPPDRVFRLLCLFIARHFPFPSDKQTNPHNRKSYSSACEMLMKQKCESHQGQKGLENNYLQHFSHLA